MKSPQLPMTAIVASPKPEARHSSKVYPNTQFVFDSAPSTPRGDRVKLDPNLNQSPAPNWSREYKSRFQSKAVTPKFDGRNLTLSTQMISPRNTIIEDGRLSQSATPHRDRSQPNQFANQSALRDINSRVSSPKAQTFVDAGSVTSLPTFSSPRSRSSTPKFPKPLTFQVSVASEPIQTTRNSKLSKINEISISGTNS